MAQSRLIDLILKLGRHHAIGGSIPARGIFGGGIDPARSLPITFSSTSAFAALDE